MLDIEALVKEAYWSLKLKIEAERKDTKEPDDGDQVVSPEAKVGAYVEVGERYIGTTGEGVERATLSTCGERTTEDKIGDGEAAITDSGEHECDRTQWSEMSSESESSTVEACTEGIATCHDIEAEVAMDKTTSRK